MLIVLISIFFAGCPQQVFYKISITIEGDGQVLFNPYQPEYSKNQKVKITAEPENGWKFDHWEDALSGSVNSANIIMNSNKNVKVVFVEETFSLSVVIQGNGNVSISPEKENYSFDETVILTANSETKWTFDHWVGDLTGNQNPATINMHEDKNITAVFKMEDYELNIIETSDGNVLKNPDKIY
ncbi:MAG: autotransporter family porin, partial [Kosmotogales bacterium]|nr:autotransporter family porin [Kosmotogales bacterium]